jgi:hypothetical protein
MKTKRTAKYLAGKSKSIVILRDQFYKEGILEKIYQASFARIGVLNHYV